VNIKDIHEGVDFFFGQRGHALKFVDFLQGVVPIRFRGDKQLISHDIHTSTYNYKYTFSVEIAPVCKDDLICLNHKLAGSMGSIGPLVLVTRVTSNITLMDPLTLRSTSMEAPVYWRAPFKAMCSSRQLVEYVILDIEPLEAPQSSGTGKWQLAEAQVARSSDFGRNDTVFFCRTHLGHLLNPGDLALGYDLANANLVDMDFEAHVNRGGRVPDVMLVKKSYEEKRRKHRQRQRNWQLKHLDMEMADERGRNEQSDAADRERFLQELEEDPEMRARINLYKDPAAAAAAAGGPGAAAAPAGAVAVAGLHDGGDSEEDGEELPQVPLDELLDDLEGLGLSEVEEGPEADGQVQQQQQHGDVDMMEH